MAPTPLVLLAVLGLCVPMPGEAQTQRVVDPDSALSVEVPGTWIRAELGSADASVQMSDSLGSVGMMIIVEPKADFFGWNMNRFLYVTLGQGVGALDLPEIGEIQRDPIDGADAATVAVFGAVGGQQYAYLRSAIDAPNHYVQVILFTSRSGWETHREEMQAVLASVDLLES